MVVRHMTMTNFMVVTWRWLWHDYKWYSQTVTIDGSHMTVTIYHQVSWPVISLHNSGNKYLPPPSSKLMLYTSSFTVCTFEVAYAHGNQ